MLLTSAPSKGETNIVIGKYRHWNGRSWPAVDENEDKMLAERAEYLGPSWMQH